MATAPSPMGGKEGMPPMATAPSAMGGKEAAPSSLPTPLEPMQPQGGKGAPPVPKTYGGPNSLNMVDGFGPGSDMRLPPGGVPIGAGGGGMGWTPNSLF